MGQINVMTFLNEIAMRYPHAISFAAGQPCPDFYDNDMWGEYISLYEESRKSQGTTSSLYQYGSSRGSINAELVRYLLHDEKIEVSEGDIIVTNGCQESLTVIAMSELKESTDCAVIIEPAYIGFYEVANSLQKRVLSVDYKKILDSESKDICCKALEKVIKDIERKGLSVKLLYLNPDFNNPLGYKLSLDTRKSIINLAAKSGFKIIEDNPYTRFSFDEERLPSIYALDKVGVTYHLGSFSKTLCPGLRVGYLVKPQIDTTEVSSLSAIKSCISINTSPVTQAIVGGFLMKHNYSFDYRMKFLNKQYSMRRDAMYHALEEYLKPLGCKINEKVTGGFFQVVELPFEITNQWIEKCASEEGVIVLPVKFFCIESKEWNNHIRLSFSFYDEDMILTGIQRLACSIKQYCVSA